MDSKSLSIGWYFSDKKSKNFGWPDVIEYLTNYGHKVTRINPDDESTHGPFDVIINKFTDHLASGTEESNILKQKLEAVFDKNKDALIFDPLDGQNKTTNREVMHEFFCHLNSLPEEYNVRCPQGLTLNSEEDIESLPANFKFPCFLKSIVASGSLAAHRMRIVWNKDDMKKFGFPIYVQEYLNHNATLFKIYCIGDVIHTIPRKSIPNFTSEYREPIVFDSQKWKYELPPEFTVDYAAKYEKPDEQTLLKLTKEMGQYLGLTIFGYDLITDIETGKYAVIDVNYFPGMSNKFGIEYRGVEYLPKKLLEHFQKGLAAKEQKESS